MAIHWITQTKAPLAQTQLVQTQIKLVGTGVAGADPADPAPAVVSGITVTVDPAAQNAQTATVFQGNIKSAYQGVNTLNFYNFAKLEGTPVTGGGIICSYL
ncbi:Hsr recombination casette protein [Helicobacter mustelae]|uniref:hypothetical protein n=1 Tax=Helicobacter mustelae TaxID=217 RepID=UPI000E007356|nr:hypothetical protein [Helicobacter mustelae]STP12753.1 Hsr recombination casette protein [Helicobacter mustelae]